MLNIVSIAIGLVTLVLGLVAFIPLLGWMNWLVIPIGIVGAALGAMSSSNGGRRLRAAFAIMVGDQRRAQQEATGSEQDDGGKADLGSGDTHEDGGNAVRVNGGLRIRTAA